MEKGTLRHSVLVVDDEPMLLDVLGFEVEAWGYEVDLAKDGIEALKSMAKKAYSLVITDQTMPGISGAELIKKTCEPGSAGLQSKYILLSGHSKEQLEGEISTHKEHVVILEKPLNMQLLKEAAKYLIDGQLKVA